MKKQKRQPVLARKSKTPKQGSSSPNPKRKQERAAKIAKQHNVVGRVIKHWLHAANKHNVLHRLTEVLSIYNFAFLKRALPFVTASVSDGTIPKRPPVVIVAKKVVDHFTPPVVTAHLVLRHPIHINGPQYVDINTTTMQKVLGYGPKDADTFPVVDPGLRYGILGEALVRHPEDASAPHPPFKTFFVCHTWGVNLESKSTTDGQAVFEDGSFSIAIYSKLLQDVMDIVEASARHIQHTTSKRVIVRTTRLGMGAWAHAIPAEYKKQVVKMYDTMLLTIQRRNQPWLTIHIVDYPNRRVLGASGSSGFVNVVNNNHDPFWGPPKTDVDRKLHSQIEQPGTAVMLCNAWDDRSYIGNGGSADNTLDGWMVAGSGMTPNEWFGPMGSNAINTSFLHNPVFEPEMVNVANWHMF